MKLLSLFLLVLLTACQPKQEDALYSTEQCADLNYKIQAAYNMKAELDYVGNLEGARGMQTVITQHQAIYQQKCFARF